MSVPTIKITIAIECPPALPGELVGRLVRLQQMMPRLLTADLDPTHVADLTTALETMTHTIRQIVARARASADEGESND